MNNEILLQGAVTIGLMIMTLAPELWALAKGIPNKAVICLLGILSKIAGIYFFTAVISGNFLG